MTIRRSPKKAKTYAGDTESTRGARYLRRSAIEAGSAFVDTDYMKREGTTTAPLVKCSGKTRLDALCRGYARYACGCGRFWCGTHVLRSGSELRCPVCGLSVAPAEQASPH